MTLKKILIDGDWRESGETITVRAPYSNEVIADVATAGDDDIERSLSAAVAAARDMLKLPRYQISKALRKITAGI